MKSTSESNRRSTKLHKTKWTTSINLQSTSSVRLNAAKIQFNAQLSNSTRYSEVPFSTNCLSYLVWRPSWRRVVQRERQKVKGTRDDKSSVPVSTVCSDDFRCGTLAKKRWWSASLPNISKPFTSADITNCIFLCSLLQKRFEPLRQWLK